MSVQQKIITLLKSIGHALVLIAMAIAASFCFVMIPYGVLKNTIEANKSMTHLLEYVVIGSLGTFPVSLTAAIAWVSLERFKISWRIRFTLGFILSSIVTAAISRYVYIVAMALGATMEQWIFIFVVPLLLSGLATLMTLELQALFFNASNQKFID